VTLHPGALKHYEAMVANLQKCIEAKMTEGNREYNEAIREMVETVTARPGSEPGRLEVEIEGALTAFARSGSLSPRAKRRGGIDGSGGRTRTGDLRIMIPLL
jgi:hypothetical protein